MQELPYFHFGPESRKRTQEMRTKDNMQFSNIREKKTIKI